MLHVLHVVSYILLVANVAPCNMLEKLKTLLGVDFMVIEETSYMELRTGENGHGVANKNIKPIEICTSDKLNEILGTLFPYGLNMDGHTLPGKVKNTYTHLMQNKADVPIYSAFNVKKNERDQRGSKSNANGIVSTNSSASTNSNANEFDPEAWTQQFIRNTSNDDDIVHSLRTLFFKLKKAAYEAIISRQC